MQDGVAPPSGGQELAPPPLPSPSLCSVVPTVVAGNDDGVVDNDTAGECSAGDVSGCSVGAVGVGGAAADGVAGIIDRGNAETRSSMGS